MQCWRVRRNRDSYLHSSKPESYTELKDLCIRNHAGLFHRNKTNFLQPVQTPEIPQVSHLMLTPFTVHALPMLLWQRLGTTYNVVALRHQVQDPCLQAMLEFDHHLNVVTEHLAAYYIENQLAPMYIGFPRDKD